MRFSLRLRLILTLAALAVVAAPVEAGSNTKLLLHDHKHSKPYPELIANNVAWFESERWFVDGMFVRLKNSSFNVMRTGVTLDYQTAANEVAPLKNLNSSTLKHFFAMVFDHSAPHFDDDAGWARVAQNWATLARAIKEAGFKGISYDNENYAGGHWHNYPDSSYCSGTLKECSDKARARGRQVMEAMKAVFPDIYVLHFHGPTLSEPDAPEHVSGTPYIVFPGWQHANEMKGPFFVGMMEGMGSGAKMIDGGELYMLRDEVGFDAAYDFQKYGIASDAVDCIFIPPELRPSYPDKVSPCYGIYDVAYKGSPMSVSIYHDTVLLALRHADDYIWLYPNKFTFLTPTSDSSKLAWINAAKQAKIDYQGSVPTSPPVSPSPTAGPSQPVCFGANNTIDGDDALSWGAGYLTSATLPDVNADGRINSFEFGYLVSHWGKSCQ